MKSEKNDSAPAAQSAGRPPLEGWASIAGYLGVSDRTAREWANKEGLPVHSLQIGKGRRVRADPNELDSWIASRTLLAPSLPSRRFPRWLPVGVLASMVCAGLVVWRFRAEPSPSPPQSLPFTAGRLFWRAAAEQGGHTAIALPSSPQWTVASPDGLHAYIASDGLPFFTHADILNRTAKPIPAPVPVRSIALSPDGNRLYLGSFADGVAILNASTFEPIEIIPTGGAIHSIAITPDGQRLYLAMMHQGVKRFDLRDRSWKQITHEECPYFVAIDQAGSKLAISYQCGGPTGRSGHNVVEVFDLPSERSRRIISGFPSVGGDLQWNPQNGELWLDGLDACQTLKYDRIGCPPGRPAILHILQPDSGILLKTLTMDSNPGRPHFFAGGARVLLPQSLEVRDARRRQAYERLGPPLSRSPGYGLVLPDDSKAYLASVHDQNLHVFETENADCALPETGLSHFLSADGVVNDAVHNSRIEPSEHAQFASGFVGQAIRLGPASPALEIRGTSGFRFVEYDSTLALYLKSGKPASAGSILENHMQQEGWRLQMAGNGKLQFHLTAGTGDSLELESSQALQPLRWYHVALTKAEGTIHLYIDGERTASATSSRAEFNHPRVSHRITMGSSANGTARWEGLLDELAIWARVLDPAEIRSMYRRRLVPPCKP